MMVKPVKKRAIQEWKMTEAIQPKEKVPEPTPKAVMNHVEKYNRTTTANLLTQPSVMHPSHPYHIPPHGVMIQGPGDPHPALRNHYVEPMYIHPQSIPRSTGPPNVIIRPPERQSHPALINPSDITGLPGRGAKRPQMPQDMAAVEAKASRKRRKPEGTTELVMSPFLNGSVNGSVHINEKVPPIQPIILDFEVPLPPISPTTPHPDEKIGSGFRGDGNERKAESLGVQAMSPVHSPAREDDPRHLRTPGGGGADPRHPSKPGSDHPPNLFKKPDINHYKSSISTGGTRCFICQNSIIPNPKDYPVAPSGLVICTKCRKLAKSGSPVAIGPPPKIQIPNRSSQSRSQPQQRIPRSPVAKSPAASLTLPRSPLPKSPARSPAPSSPLPNSSPSSPANTLSAPNSPASTSGLSVPGSPRYSAPNSPRYSAPNSPRNSAPSSPVSRPPGSPLPRHPSIVVSRSPFLNSSSVSQPPSPRPMEHSSGRRHSISGAHLEVHVGGGVSKASPTGSIGAVTSPRSGSAADSPVSMENLQLPPGREGDDTTIRALLQLGRMKADGERRTMLQGSNSRALDQGELRLPRSLADISKLDQAQLLELQHRLKYAGLPSRCYQQESQGSPNHDDTGTKISKGHHLSKSSLSPNSAQSGLHIGNGPPLMRSEGVVGTALPITALSSSTEDAPLKISRVIRSAREHAGIDHRRSHSPSDPQNKLRESLESLHKTGRQCSASRLTADSHLDKSSKYYKKDGSRLSVDLYRDQYAVFQCHCSGSEVFFIKCPDCDFICNSIFGMELHVAAQRHGDIRGPPPSRDPDYVDEQSCKESRADSEASHSSFETQSADTEAEGSVGGSPPRTAQEASPNVYSPVPGSIPEAWRDQVTSRMRSGSGVVDLGSTVPHVNIPRPLAQGLGSDLRPGPTELPSPLDLSGKRSAEPSHLEHRERSGSRERRGHESNGPLDLSGYKHIQTPNSQFVSSQRLGSVGSMIEKSVASSVPSLALSQTVSQMPPGIPAMAVPGMMLASGASSASQPPYPIPTMLYPLSSLAGTIPLLGPIHFQSASAPPSPNHSKHLEGSQPRRASYSLAPPTERSSKSASPTPAMLSPQEPSRQTLSVPQQSHSSQGSGGKALSYQGGTITIQPSASSLSSSTPQKTVTLESQFSRSSPATPQSSHSPQTPMPSSPAPLLSSTVQTQAAVWVKSEPHSDEESERDRGISRSEKDKESTNCQKDKSDKDDVRVDKSLSIEQKDVDGEKEKEKEMEKEPEKSSLKIPTSSSSNPHPTVQIKIEQEI